FIVLIFFTLPHIRPVLPLFPYTTLFRSFLPAFPALRISSGQISHAPSVFIRKLYLPQKLLQRLPGQQNSQRRRQDQHRRQTSLQDRKSTRLNSSHVSISYAVFCLKKKKT